MNRRCFDKLLKLLDCPGKAGIYSLSVGGSFIKHICGIYIGIDEGAFFYTVGKSPETPSPENKLSITQSIRLHFRIRKIKAFLKIHLRNKDLEAMIDNYLGEEK